ncbi:hypothetical protein NC653_023210 [Populus alba x Populus x berolinensis]|uniref:Uncharacterized protein n=1 Tax=Populus alba x Populus x berolinensis TaxID=444605 RepID=A0AAD6QAL6_9ROSI|nr:hypothetical protein NC653_023210 [Populus alba x Populus x berolinensis]
MGMAYACPGMNSMDECMDSSIGDLEIKQHSNLDLSPSSQPSSTANTGSKKEPSGNHLRRHRTGSRSEIHGRNQSSFSPAVNFWTHNLPEYVMMDVLKLCRLLAVMRRQASPSSCFLLNQWSEEFHGRNYRRFPGLVVPKPSNKGSSGCMQQSGPQGCTAGAAYKGSVRVYIHSCMGSKIGCTCETGAGAEMGPQWPTYVQNKGPRTSYSADVSKSPASFWGEMAWP